MFHAYINFQISAHAKVAPLTLEMKLAAAGFKNQNQEIELHSGIDQLSVYLEFNENLLPNDFNSFHCQHYLLYKKSFN